MKKTYGVCFGMLAMGLAMIGAPVSRAQSRMAAGGSGGGSETTTASAPATPAASSPADLDRRIEALETELSELRTELTAKKEADAAAASAAAAAPAPAVTVAAQDAAKPPEKTTVASLLGPTSISGFVDTYYAVNFNHPASSDIDFRSFDYNSHQIALNMVELVLDKAPSSDSAIGRTGYHVALGYGQAMTAMDFSEQASSGCATICNTDPGFSQYLKEAYFSYLAPVGKGLQVDVGKFVTPMGAEVIESKDNWNYSRGLLFSYAIPYFHFGARAKYVFNDKFALTGFLVNGWNNILDNNTGKTYGMSFGWTPTKTVSATVTYLAGPETTSPNLNDSNFGGSGLNVNNYWRQTWDAVVTYSPMGKWAFMANYDYGRGDRTITNFETTPVTLSPPVYWTGLAGYVKYTPNDKNYLAARYEYYYDHDGFTTGEPQHIHYNEVTATYQRTIASHLLARLEYRRDSASRPVYDLANFTTPIKYQNTATIGLIFLFDSRDAK